MTGVTFHEFYEFSRRNEVKSFDDITDEHPNRSSLKQLNWNEGL